MVRDLDDWKLFQETKVKAKAGEHRELLGRVFRYTPEKQDTLMKKYTDDQLRQRICMKDSTKDIFEYEKNKNDIVLDVLRTEETRLFLEIVSQNDDINRDRALLVKLRRQSEELETVITAHREKTNLSFNMMEKRKTFLRDTGKIGKLKYMANMRGKTEKAPDRLDVESEKRSPRYPKLNRERIKPLRSNSPELRKEYQPEVNIPGIKLDNNIEEEIQSSPEELGNSFSSQIQEFENDFYEMDRVYLRNKLIYRECNKAIQSIR